VLLALGVSCGKSGDNNPERKANPQGKAQAEKARGNRDSSSEPGQKPGSKPQSSEDIDIDKLDIPDRMKEAIKSGRIPKEQVAEMLALKNLNSYLVLNGIVEPERKVEIFSRLSAYVKEIVKEEGAYVKENDTLVLLDDTEIKISYEQSKIELEQARLTLEEAEQNYVRNQELKKRDLISEQDFQTQEALYKQRELDHQNRAESFKNLQLQLNWTKIRSLSEGYITERLIEVGDRVNANQQVYTIEDFRPLLIRVYVPTSDSIKLKTGMPTEVTTEVIRGAMFEGNVKLINPRIDVQTGTVKVTVEVFDDSLRLKPGMFVEARIVIGMKENVLVIPRKAILYKQNLTYVFVMNRNQVSQREVTLGLSEEDDVEVLSGLEEGETIVAVGVEGLKDGQRVDVIQ
jgi:RND family efflux transporter MFP subunit